MHAPSVDSRQRPFRGSAASSGLDPARWQAADKVASAAVECLVRAAENVSLDTFLRSEANSQYSVSSNDMAAPRRLLRTLSTNNARSERGDQ